MPLEAHISTVNSRALASQFTELRPRTRIADHLLTLGGQSGGIAHDRQLPALQGLPRMLDQVLAPLVRGTGHGECLYGVVSPSERELFRTWAQALAPDHSRKRSRDRTTHS